MVVFCYSLSHKRFCCLEGVFDRVFEIVESEADALNGNIVIADGLQLIRNLLIGKDSYHSS